MNPIRVLILDDDDTIRDGLSNYLEDAGFEVAAAATDRQAVEFLDTRVFDAAVVDLRLTETDGESFILRVHTRFPQLKFLIYTGSTAYDLSPALNRVGMRAQDVIRKPAPDLNVIAQAIVRITHTGER